jgi:hypothetical protein
MALPTFTDITKTIKDLLTKEFPGEKSKIEVTTNTANNNTFVSTLTRNWEKGDYVAAFNPKFKRPEHGLSGNVSVDTNGELKAEVAVADQLVDGLKVTVTGVTGPESKNPPAKIAAEYRSGNTATASATVELFHPTNGTTVALGVVGGHEGFEGGVEVKALAEKQELAQISGVVGYRNSEFAAHAQVTQKGEALDTKLTYLHNINSGFVVVGDVNFDAKKVKETHPTVEFGGSYKLDDVSTVKAKVNNSGIFNWSFTQSLSKNLKVCLGGSVNAKKLKDGSEHKLGLDVILSS